MTRPDPLGPLRRRDGDAAFDEAWQAQALAIADCLTRAGVFTPAQWAEALGREVRAQPDTTEGYYRAVLAALETLLDGTGALSQAALDARRDAWARAYEATPHGQPVILAAGDTA